MATKQQVLAACRRRWPSREVSANLNPHAPIGEERAALIQRRNELRAEIDQLSGKTNWEKVARQLLDAAQFVCDVNGDHPSIEQLREAMIPVQQRLRMIEAKAEWDELRNRLIRRRCEVMHREPGGLGLWYAATGDSWDECLEQIGVKTAAASEAQQ